MADPFLGIFDGVNNGLDDLGLGSTLGTHGSQGGQLQERLQQSASFPGYQSQSLSNTNQTKLQHFDDRSSGSPFLPPSQKLQHFNDPLLSSSPQRFHSMQSSSQQQFSEFRSPSQINMCWPRGQPSRSSPIIVDSHRDLNNRHFVSHLATGLRDRLLQDFSISPINRQ